MAQTRIYSTVFMFYITVDIFHITVFYCFFIRYIPVYVTNVRYMLFCCIHIPVLLCISDIAFLVKIIIYIKSFDKK